MRRETFVERRQSTVRWGAVIAGALVAIAVWMALQMLGLGVGLASIDTDEGGSLRGVGIGTGVWSVIAPLIALFIGGWAAARAGGVFDRTVGAIHGGTVWALTTILGLVMMTWTIGAVVGATARAGAQLGQVASSVDLSTLGIDTQDVLVPINERLRAQGKPTITASELEAATDAVMRRAVREGTIDREMVVTALARNTDLTRQDAQEIANRLEQQFMQARGQASGLADDAATAARVAADRTGKVLLGGAIALLLGLAAAVGGAVLGAHRQNRSDRGTTTITTPTVPPPTVA